MHSYIEADSMARGIEQPLLSLSFSMNFIRKQAHQQRKWNVLSRLRMSRFDTVALRECSVTEWTARIVAGSTLWVVWGLRRWRRDGLVRGASERSSLVHEIVNDSGGSTDC